MQLATIDMPRAEARKAYLEYRDAIKERQQAELDEVQRRQFEQDKAIARAYRHLSVGNQLIRLSDAILGGGFDDRCRPRMAVMRADFDEVYMRRWRSGRLQMTPAAETWTRARDKHFRFEAPEDDRINMFMEAVATAPTIPPEFRPDHHLRNYHLLWEAEWRALRTSSRAPRDPALLKRLGGDIWAVLAVWDLTDVEMAVLEGARV